MRIWVALILALTVSSGAIAAEGYQRIPFNNLVLGQLDPALTGYKFDVEAGLKVGRGNSPDAEFWGNAYLDLNGLRVFVDMDHISPALQSAIREQCFPQPCLARMLVTVSGKFSWVLDGMVLEAPGEIER